jgi:hypothetical protein
MFFFARAGRLRICCRLSKNSDRSEFSSVNVYRDKFTEIGRNGFLEISREKREKLLAVGFEFFQ